MRVDLSPYAIAAFVVVVGAAAAAAGLVEAIRRWVQGLVRRAPVVAAVGLGLLAVVAANTLVARSCGPAGSRSRPLLAAFSDDPCRAESVAQVVLVVVVAGVTTLVAWAVAHRRPHPHADELLGHGR